VGRRAVRAQRVEARPDGRWRARPRATPGLAGAAGRWLLVLAVGLAIGLWLGLPGAAAGESAGGVTVHYLANEGVLLEDGQRGVLLDGCVRQPYAGYAAVPDAVWQRLLTGEPPFDTLRLVLVSHAHRDHFQVAPARELLLARRDLAWVVHREVADALAKDWGSWSLVSGAVTVVAPADGEVARWEGGGIAVEIRRLPHGKARTMPENLAHVVHLGGRSLVHVGDAAASVEDLDRAGLTAGGYDVGLLPYWFWLADTWKPARERLGGRLGTVALHLPPDEAPPSPPAGEPAPVVLRAPLEQRRF
jgi:L-ascorbate metabolism protein UlaG (beta-lactamase superfamily)